MPVAVIRLDEWEDSPRAHHLPSTDPFEFLAEESSPAFNSTKSVSDEITAAFGEN